ncbi:hypothetical protein HYU14_05630 [Candidatus Woesearchaeota archaeon]|nr:hypothetical protein [Candidatus Woesearchaeota archaeon]
MDKKLAAILGLIAVASGLVVIFRVIVDTEIAIGFVTVSFGVLAVIWTTMAIGALSKGSSLRKHTTNFLYCLLFILLFSIWHTISKLLRWRETVNEMLLYPGYVFITMAFLIFVVTAYQILTMSKEFGFELQAQDIRKVIEQKKARRKRKSIRD